MSKVLRVSKSMRLIRFPLLWMVLAIQGPVYGRPNLFHKYNDGEIAFRDFGPVRIYRYYWREKRHGSR